VRVSVSATNDFDTGLAGFVQRWRSLLTGLRITAKHATETPATLRYPAQKVELSPRWRGALRLTGVLGTESGERRRTRSVVLPCR